MKTWVNGSCETLEFAQAHRTPILFSQVGKLLLLHFAQNLKVQCLQVLDGDRCIQSGVWLAAYAIMPIQILLNLQLFRQN